MKGKHSPEPWTFFRRKPFSDEGIADDYLIRGADGALAAETNELIGLHRDTDRKENARRIVACVNACAGFDTELLELAASGTAPSLREIFREHGDLWKQREDLLEALKNLLSGLSTDDEEGLLEHVPQVAEARAIIAKVEVAA